MSKEYNAEVYENDIMLYLQLYCEDQGIDDLRTASQSVWNSALYYIYKHVFKGTNKLKSGNIYGTDILTNSIMPCNCNTYDHDIVSDVLNIYIYDMCMKYDKEVSIVGFSTLTGISEETIYNWGRSSNTGVLSSCNSDIYKKLYHYREESLSAKLATANKNPVGILAILNRHYQWNLPGVSRENTETRRLSAADLPKLAPPEIVQIEQKSGVEDDGKQDVV